MNNRSYFIAALLAILSFTSCTDNNGNKRGLFRRKGHYPDYALAAQMKQKPFDSTGLIRFLDTASVAKEFTSDILSFYRDRDFHYAWFDGDTLLGSVYTFFNMQDFLRNTMDAVPGYAQPLEKLTAETGNAPGNFPDSLRKLQMEFMLTTQFFVVSKIQYAGVVQKDKQLKDLEWFIPRRKKNYQVLLDSLVAGAVDLQDVEPVTRQYLRLKNALNRYYAIAHSDTIPLTQKDTSFYHKLRIKLYLRGDIADSSSYANDAGLKAGIRSWQQRYGLKDDGQITAELVTRLNQPVQSEIRKILINMERLRWMPQEPDSIHIFVNIPEYRLHVYNDTTELWAMNVVVGKDASRTTIFNGKLSMIVFAPYWNIPQSIIVNELLPSLKNDPSYADKKNMEVLKDGKVVASSSVDWKSFSDNVPYQLRQKPGSGNSLGKVKFMFPNQYSIYLHDTPAKDLFSAQDRSFSHGCIRLAEPVKLAQFLLQNQPEWDEQSIVAAMNAKTEQTVQLDKKIPVLIGYFTSWVDEQGRVNFREDIYDHDSKLARELFD